MCGRFTNQYSWRELHALYDLSEQSFPASNFQPRYNLAPTQEAPVVRIKDGKRELAFLKWGLVPSLSKDATGAAKLSAGAGRRRPAREGARVRVRPSRHRLFRSEGRRPFARLAERCRRSGRPARHCALRRAGHVGRRALRACLRAGDAGSRRCLFARERGAAAGHGDARGAGPQAAAWFVARAFPNYLRKRLEQFRPDHMTEAMVRARMVRIGQWLGGEDRRLMQNPELLELLARTMMETGRQNGQGNRSEIERLARPWGFDIRTIAVPVFLFHGAEDRIMHVGPARRLARALRHCVPTFYPTEGHFSILINRAEDLMSALVSVA